ncbi:MAG TPA: hypothetical protein VN673_11885 [Clostridia bacterium]|nr:hypothetical protein [Clostridia bacterium]
MHASLALNAGPIRPGPRAEASTGQGISESPTPRVSAVPEVASRVRAKYGPKLGWEQLLELLQDRECVPWPCEVRFDADPLLPGEFAHTFPNSQTPLEGYRICVHPVYEDQPEVVPYLVLQQVAFLVLGAGATPDDAEAFGAACFGLTRDHYYMVLCDLAALAGGDELC